MRPEPGADPASVVEGRSRMQTVAEPGITIRGGTIYTLRFFSANQNTNFFLMIMFAYMFIGRFFDTSSQGRR